MLVSYSVSQSVVMPFKAPQQSADAGCVVCVCVYSGVEYAGCVMNLDQYRVLSKTEPDQMDQNEPQSGKAHSRPTDAFEEIKQTCFEFPVKLNVT